MSLLGSRLDALGVSQALDDGDLIEGAVVITKVLLANGDVRVALAWSDGMDFITRRGLQEIALDSDRIPPQEALHDE